jgi:hypothetical protein
MNRRPKLKLVAPAASAEEAAAIVAALERFMRDTAPPHVARAPAVSAWLAAARREAVSGAPDPFVTGL